MPYADHERQKAYYRQYYEKRRREDPEFRAKYNREMTGGRESPFSCVCGSDTTRVLKATVTAFGLARVRQCPRCLMRFRTLENVVQAGDGGGAEG